MIDALVTIVQVIVVSLGGVVTAGVLLAVLIGVVAWWELGHGWAP